LAAGLSAGACGGDDDADVPDAGDAADVDAHNLEDGTGDLLEMHEGRDTADAEEPRPPICEGGTGSGTRRRWVDPLTGFQYCEATCADCEAVCLNDGTRSEGWYADCGAGTTEGGCTETGVPGLIDWANCL
jgi:hypothetical protein